MIPLNLLDWATKHHVSHEALAELTQLSVGLLVPPPPAGAPDSESRVQSEVRLEAAQKGVRLWRNNVGVLEDRRGVPVRFGLANDNAALNHELKSHDLIGWRPVTITPAMVGCVIAQFVSRECKRRDWVYSPKDPHSAAQNRWAQLVLADGGDAAFATGPGTL